MDSQSNNYILPITIVVAGLLIAGAVFLAGKSSTTGQNNGNGSLQAANFRAIDANDHVLGNPNAKVKVIEYMDLECPHCKLFNTTMHQIMDYYGMSGQVARVQRPFPLGSIHSKAPKEAEAAECAAEQGGSQAYFNYTDKVFEVTPSDNGLDLAQLPVIAKDVGLDVTKFNTCLNSGKYAQKVQASYDEAIAAGGQGTPYILVTYGTDALTLSGDQPYDSMRAAIDQVLQAAGVSVTPTGAQSTSSTTQTQ